MTEQREMRQWKRVVAKGRWPDRIAFGMGMWHGDSKRRLGRWHHDVHPSCQLNGHRLKCAVCIDPGLAYLRREDRDGALEQLRQARLHSRSPPIYTTLLNPTISTLLLETHFEATRNPSQSRDGYCAVSARSLSITFGGEAPPAFVYTSRAYSYHATAEQQPRPTPLYTCVTYPETNISPFRSFILKT